MNETITIDAFSRKSIVQAKDRLTKISKKVGGGSHEAVKNLTQAGYEYMKSIAPVFTGELAGSITWEYDESTNTGRIIVGSGYALYVEYGTGIVGASRPHPEPAPGWTYDSNGHGEKGWTYFDEQQNRFYHTRGEQPHAFVYKTKEYMKSIAASELKVSLLNA
jgi:hypothetical protein